MPNDTQTAALKPFTVSNVRGGSGRVMAHTIEEAAMTIKDMHPGCAYKTETLSSGSLTVNVSDTQTGATFFNYMVYPAD